MRSRRERRIQAFQRRVANPIVRPLARLGVYRGAALLETIGRRSGQPRLTPVGNGLERGGDVFWVVAEHGEGAAWVRNLQANPRVRVKLGRRWRAGTATVLPGDDTRARMAALARLGVARRVNDVAVRAFGTRLLTVRIDLDPGPGPR